MLSGRSPHFLPMWPGFDLSRANPGKESVTRYKQERFPSYQVALRQERQTRSSVKC